MERRRELPLATQTTSGLNCRNIEDTDDTTTNTTTVLPLLKKRSTTAQHESRRLQKSTK